MIKPIEPAAGNAANRASTVPLRRTAAAGMKAALTHLKGALHGGGAKPKLALLFLSLAAVGGAGFAVTRHRHPAVATRQAPVDAPAMTGFSVRTDESSVRLDAERQRLESLIDRVHAAEVAEAARRGSRRYPHHPEPILPGHLRRATHIVFEASPVPVMGRVTVVYHRGRCPACERNFRVRRQLDAIYQHQGREAQARPGKLQLPPAFPKLRHGETDYRARLIDLEIRWHQARGADSEGAAP